MLEFEKIESERIQKLLVRGETEVWIKDNFFYKNMNASEVLAYKEISPHRSQLLLDANLQIPEFYGAVDVVELNLLRNIYNVKSTNLFKISYLGGLRHKEIDESFGARINYNNFDFRFIFCCMSVFRRIVRPVNQQFEDYENSALDLLKNSKPKIDLFINFNARLLFESIEDTESLLETAPLVATHRDLNWNNMEIIMGIDGCKNLQLADWGSFGLAYEGYDEGRLFTRLCLNPKLQENYLESLKDFIEADSNLKHSFQFLVSFWRTVAIRSYREMYLTINGRYDKLIKDRFGSGTFKSDFIGSLEKNITIATNNLAKM
jgi:hypothetical protein